MPRIHWLGLIGRFLVMRFAGHRWAEPDHLAGGLIDQQNIFIRVGLFLAAVVFFLHDGVRWALTAPFGAINGQRWAPFPGQRAGRNLLGVAFWLHPEVSQRVLEDGEQIMNPIVCLRLTQIEMQGVHRLERIGLLVDENEHEFIGLTVQLPLRATADTALPRFAFARAIIGILFFVRGLKGW